MFCPVTLVELILACLPLLGLVVAGDAADDILSLRKTERYQQLHQDRERAISSSSVSASFSGSFSSSSSSSYVPSFPASSTFTYSFGLSSHVPAPTPTSCGSEDCKFYDSKTAPYFISEWPDVGFDTGECEFGWFYIPANLIIIRIPGEFYGGSTPVRGFHKQELSITAIRLLTQDSNHV